MNKTLERLSVVQSRIAARYEFDFPMEEGEKLLFCSFGDWVHVEFYGLPFDESFEDVAEVLCEPEVAEQVGVLVLRGPDEGANGTKAWDLTPILESDAVFPKLRSVFIEPTLPEHHNQSIIANSYMYEEDGQIARLLGKMPAVESLTVPSAPNACFFEVGSTTLRNLQVQAGYDTQDFIGNLAQSKSFPALRSLNFGDYKQRYMEDYPAGCTPFEQYEELFRSEAFSRVTWFRLRNSILSAEQLQVLRALQTDCQFTVLQEPPEKVIRELI